jgi:hypothetical protein
MGGDDSQKLFALEGNVTPVPGAANLRRTGINTLPQRPFCYRELSRKGLRAVKDNCNGNGQQDG